MTMLTLSFLGSPLIERDGAAVEMRLRKAMALLAYLAVTGQRHSRDTLAELLYPEKDRTDSRSDLRRSLSILRGAIGSECLDSDRACVWFVFREGTRIDVVDFRGLITESRKLESTGDLPGSAVKLEKAATLYRGEFLSGLFLKDSPAFEEWQLSESESLRHEQGLALQQLVEIEEGMGRIPQALENARRLLSLDVLEESSHRALMRLEALGGRRSAALRRYATCRRVLQRELGQEPEEETEKLRKAIAAGQLVAGRPEEQPRVRPKVRKLGSRVKSSPSGTEPAAEVILVTDAGEPARTYPTIHSAVLAVLERMRPATGAGAQVALHAGTPQRANVILSAAHPGQVLLSDGAAALVAESFPEGASTRSLGAHRLKDLGPPVALFQLVHPDLRQDFPPLKTLDSLPNNLPSQPTPFIGREAEVAAVLSTLQSDEVRLLTLTGPGGSGKTRLALQAAVGVVGQFAQGVFFVDFSMLRDPGQVILAIAATLDVRDIAGAQRPILEVLKGHLKARNVLLVLDNLEHLLDAAPEIVEILIACPLVKVLATSREALRLRGEQEFPVPPLRLPPPNEPAGRLGRFEAVRFFVERASRSCPDIMVSEENAITVAGICVRLDGLPLALELAAARMKALSPRALLERLDSRQALGMIGPRDLPTRQRTLQQEIDWSHELLAEPDKRLFRRLSVFAGGCTFISSQAVCRLEKDGIALDVVEGLVSLVEKNLLVRRDEGGEPRYHMLQTIHDYAHERLDQSGEADEVYRRYTGYFLELVERAEPELCSLGRYPWFDRLEREHVNLLSALSWLYERDRLQGARLAGALGEFWINRTRLVEAHHWLELYHHSAGKTDPAAPRAKIAFNLGQINTAFQVEEYSGSTEILECFRESLALWRETGNTTGIALSLSWIGMHCTCLPKEERWTMLEESVRLAREVGDPWVLVPCIKMAYSGRTSVNKGRAFKEAVLGEAIAIARRAGDPTLLSCAIHGMGDVLLYDGDHAAALPWYLEYNRMARDLDEKVDIHASLFHLVTVYLALGELSLAKAACLEALRLNADFNTRQHNPRLLSDMVEIAMKEGRMKRAARLRAAAALIRKPDADFDLSSFKDLGLPEDAARAEWDAARSMTTDQAVAYALSDRV
jgi:predicted ATPase/DNA-binding SARP family transcriptional activator